MLGKDGTKVLIGLAKALNFNRPLASLSQQPLPTSKFHVDVERNKQDMKKSISNPVLLSPPGIPTQNVQRNQTVDNKDDEDDVPVYRPPAVVPSPRRSEFIIHS